MMYMNLPYKSGTRMLKPSQGSIWILDEIFKVCQLQRISSLKNIHIQIHLIKYLKFWLSNYGK